jgi:hypothetical protein
VAGVFAYAALVIAILVVMAPNSAYGQIAGFQADRLAQQNGFRFYPATVEFGRERVSFDDDSTADTTVIIVPTRVSLHHGSPRATFDFTYVPEFSLYERFSVIDSWNHAAGARFGYRLGPNLNLGVSGSLLFTNDPGRHLANSLTIIPRSNYRESFASVNLGYRMGRHTSLAISALNTISIWESLAEDATTRGERMSNSLVVGVSRAIASRHSLGGGFAHIRSEHLRNSSAGQEDPAQVAPQNSLRMTYGYSRSSGLRFAATSGIVLLPDSPTYEKTTYTLSGRVEKNWTSFGVGGVYRRTTAALRSLEDPTLPEPVRNATVSNSIVQWAEVFARGDLGSLVRLDYRLQASRTTSSAGQGDLNLFSTFLRVGFRITRRIEPYAQVLYQYQEFRGDDVSSLSRFRFMVGISLDWQPGSSVLRWSDIERVRTVLPAHLGG